MNFAHTALKWIVVIGGFAAVLIGLGHIILGPLVIPGSIPVNPTLDSEDRFFGALFVGYGVANLWVAQDLIRRSQAFRFLLGIFFLGGIARLISIAIAGLPHPFFIVMAGIELLLPLLGLWLLSRARTADSPIS